jgi:hypothetical protein
MFFLLLCVLRLLLNGCSFFLLLLSLYCGRALLTLFGRLLASLLLLPLLLSLLLFLLVPPLFSSESVVHYLLHRLLYDRLRRGYCGVLEGARDLHVDLADDILVLKHLGCRELTGLSDLLHLIVTQADYHVFRLEVCVDYLAHPVHVI